MTTAAQNNQVLADAPPISERGEAQIICVIGMRCLSEPASWQPTYGSPYDLLTIAIQEDPALVKERNARSWPEILTRFMSLSVTS